MASPVQTRAFFDLSGLSFAYAPGVDALSGISFQVAEGEMAGVIGPNGAGKSTLLLLMCGLLEPTSGRVRVRERDIHAMDPRLRARTLGFVPQASRVFFPYTVAEIVLMGRRPHVGPLAAPTPRDLERVGWAMDVTGIAPLSDRMFSQLSGGEAQRVVIARALAQDAPALVLDEPTSSLDLFYQTALYGLLERLNRDQGLTVVIVTHDVNLAAEYCPRLIGLRDGRVVADGPPAEILTSDRIQSLYGVKAEIILSNGARLVRVRHCED